MPDEWTYDDNDGWTLHREVQKMSDKTTTSVIITKLYRRDITQIMVDQGGPPNAEGRYDVDYLFLYGVSHIVCNPDEAIEIIVRRVKVR